MRNVRRVNWASTGPAWRHATGSRPLRGEFGHRTLSAMKSNRCAVWVAWVFVAVAVGAVPTAALAGGWKVVHQEAGVTVSQKEIEGRDLPIFRGATVINADIYELLGVLQDVANHPLWMHRCKEAQVLERYGEFHVLHYNRTDAPWPVSDRDTVLESKIDVSPEKATVTVRFKATKSPLRGEVADVVRMLRLRGYYKLTALSGTRTRVEYQVDADPGGSLPVWVVKMASQDMPVNTLTNLRARVRETNGMYREFRKRWDPSLNPDAPALIPR